MAAHLIASFGWQRLAGAFRVERLPRGLVCGLAYLGIDSMQYSGMGVVRATVAAEGLGLRVLFLFRVRHPPLLVPWSVLGPLVATKAWWRTMYEVTIRVSEQRSVRLRFRDQGLAAAMQPYLRLSSPRSG
ncbi:hypothetical protein [Hymenobacter sp. BT559]|uniref:hypothetical protein n=1 Tax=Hymenobacter sp. BT559 TaxID=2795729 RepID=UPI0018EC8CB5|nr:hypothetical protein [Hymenobacter sp. BT559]MBJ6143065.1 hypothetical protein [Hymenobacter sp. BT559]